jgi:hypothetical protein
MLDLTDLPVVDVHCHPFLNKGAVTPEQFTDMTAFGGGSREYMEEGGVGFSAEVHEELQRTKRDTLYFRRMLRDLAGFFGVEPGLGTVLQKRNRAVEEDYTGYVRRLYEDAGITTLVPDFGNPLPSLDPDVVRAEMPVEIVPVFRIEPLISELLELDIGPTEFLNRFDEAVSGALASGRYKGLKSVIAYRTGLDVSPLSRARDQGYEAVDAIRRGIGGNATKKLRDHLLCRSMELSMEHEVPMQIHTGMGDREVNLLCCRPAYLMNLLRFPTFRSCRVLLVHAGYPYHREAGYMANVLPRVYCDLSEGIPFAGHAAKRLVSEVLEMAPLSKVVYGSDGYTLPEINYTGAKLGKQALAGVLEDLVLDGALSEVEARQAAGVVLSDNARELYRLDQH